MTTVEGRFGDGFRLLVVDDDDGVRDVLADVFTECGFAVDAAEDLRRARERVDSRSYDLVIVDKNLPDGSGLELARYLGERQEDCEIVLITGHGTSESAFEAFELGLADVVPKPFDDLNEIRLRVRKALERLAHARRARSSRVTGRSSKGASTSTSTESERRLRFFVEMRVRFILVDGSLTGAAFVSQLSTTDLFVESDRPLPLGTRVRMRLYLPGHDAADVRGIVRRHGDGPSMLGMRVEFTDLSPEETDLIRSHLEPRRKSLEFVEKADPGGADAPALSERFTPDALRLFLGMHGGKVLDFIETLDTATVQAILDADRSGFRGLDGGEPGKTPAPFESLPPRLFDPENANPEDLPLMVDTSPSPPTEPTNEEERLRAKYRLSEELLDDSLRRKYAIDESLFDDEPAGSVAPVSPAPAPAATEDMLNKIGANADQRRVFSSELRRRGEEALSRGLIFKAASDLALAVAFDSTDGALGSLYEKVRKQANASRAEDHYRQGLQQMALGDGAAAAKLLIAAIDLKPETKYVIAAARVLLQSGDPGAAQCRTLLRDAIARDDTNPDLHVLNGKAAEKAGVPKAALRCYQRALELKPDHQAAKELIARLS